MGILISDLFYCNLQYNISGWSSRCNIIITVEDWNHLGGISSRFGPYGGHFNSNLSVL